MRRKRWLLRTASSVLWGILAASTMWGEWEPDTPRSIIFMSTAMFAAVATTLFVFPRTEGSTPATQHRNHQKAVRELPLNRLLTILLGLACLVWWSAAMISMNEIARATFPRGLARIATGWGGGFFLGMSGMLAFLGLPKWLQARAAGAQPRLSKWVALLFLSGGAIALTASPLVTAAEVAAKHWAEPAAAHEHFAFPDPLWEREYRRLGRAFIGDASSGQSIHWTKETGQVEVSS